MQEFFRTHEKTKWFTLVCATVVAALLLFLALFDWNLLRPTLARAITAKTGRAATIDGDLKVHLFTWTPNVEVNGLSIENPPWARRNPMFGAQRIAVSVSLGRLLRGQIVIPEINLLQPVINLERDDRGRASWELGTREGKPNGNTQPAKIPTIRRLIIDGGRVNVVDEIRKLRFGGSLVASDVSGKQDASAFQVRAKGSLNEKPFSLEVNGGPLLELSPDQPYSFTTHVLASDIDLQTHITIPKPFDLSDLDASFVVTGKDLADVYYLTGLALPNTPAYRLEASVKVNGTTYTVDDLKGKLGSSDLSGKVEVQAAGKRPKLIAKLTSNTLNIVDLAPTLGQPAPDTLGMAKAAKKRAKDEKNSPKDPLPTQTIVPKSTSELDAAKADDRLLPDADLQVNRVRGMDADVTYNANSVTTEKVPMKAVSLHVILDDGLLTIDPLAFALEQGKVAGSVRIDARSDVPDSSIDMHLTGVDLAQFKTAAMKQPPVSGLLTGRIKLHGKGSSIHKLGSTVDGQVSFVIPHGEINDAIAELTGINVVRGLGLLLSKTEDKTDIRCSVIDFRAEDGVVAAQTLFIDTTDVLITGRGDIHLGSEALDMSLKGDPKKVRFTRLRSPITMTGTLSHPSVGLDVKKLAAQGAVAAVLGTLLTPAAAILAFVDPGLAKNKDCAASLAAGTAALTH